MRFKATSGNGATLMLAIRGRRGVLECSWDRRPSAQDKAELDAALGVAGALHVDADDSGRAAELALRFLTAQDGPEVVQ